MNQAREGYGGYGLSREVRGGCDANKNVDHVPTTLSTSNFVKDLN